jgi:GT2 family glycosyltransferase/glycosyltransferase involved in cell wall biosynthesis
MQKAEKPAIPGLEILLLILRYIDCGDALMKNIRTSSYHMAGNRSSIRRRISAAWKQHPDSPYQASREVLRVLIPYDLRRSLVQLRRSHFGFRSLLHQFLRRVPGYRSAPSQTINVPNHFFRGVTLLPHVIPAEAEAVLAQPLSAGPHRKYDIVCLSMIDWSFRFQRPQQLMRQFAIAGHRVFYIQTNGDLSPYGASKCSVEAIDDPLVPSGNLLAVRLATTTPLALDQDVLPPNQIEELLSSLDEFRQSYHLEETVCYVMFPSWGAAARRTQIDWSWRVVYDCMDEWEMFPGVNPNALAQERALVGSADLVVVTAQKLYDKWRPHSRSITLARNAVDFDFYQERCRPNTLLSDMRGPFIGFYGAIADWFDVDLIAETARRRPNYTFVLIGGVFETDVSSLVESPNVKLLGQQPYERMPEYLFHFDACVIPFQINPITEATDPVKLYEYLSGGKPVVAVRLPELNEHADVISFADDAEQFAASLDGAIAARSESLIERRKAVARENTWARRQQTIVNALDAGVPRASVIIVTYNNLALTRLCMESVLRNTQYPNYEVILVDNHSSDQTPAYLQSLAATHSHVSILLNAENYGFARANNQGIAAATGEYLVLLNNDAVTPPGWMTRLLRHLHDPQVGLVGPATNFVGNEARIDVDYASWAEMEDFAAQFVRERERQVADISMLAMFCAAMRREVYDKIGPLDERFGVGMFEDDDYSMRVRAAGLRVICAADVFVHHFGQAAFGKLIRSGEYNAIFDQNRRLYEAKWGLEWKPHINAPLDFQPHEY